MQFIKMHVTELEHDHEILVEFEFRKNQEWWVMVWLDAERHYVLDFKSDGFVDDVALSYCVYEIKRFLCPTSEAGG